jgi:hypothetical protein
LLPQGGDLLAVHLPEHTYLLPEDCLVLNCHPFRSFPGLSSFRGAVD